MLETSPSDRVVQQRVTTQVTRIRNALPDNVRLIAVSKYVSPTLIRAAYAAGVRDFGESRVQEAMQKQEQLQDLTDITWHLIGHLQRNKAKQAVICFDWIHSVDRLSLAQRLNTLSAAQQTSPQLCLQVKLRPDSQKHGWTVAQLKRDLPQLQALSHLRIRGLMTILPLGLAESEIIATFQAARQLTTDIAQWTHQQLTLSELSMGMSGDYPYAIQAGATMVRLGQILFQPSSQA